MQKEIDLVTDVTAAAYSSKKLINSFIGIGRITV